MRKSLSSDQTGWPNVAGRLPSRPKCAAQDASDYITAHPRESCELYLVATGEKTPVDVLLQQIGDPKTSFSTAPFGMMRVASHMADIKVLRTRPTRWQEFFFPEAAELPGN